MLVAIASVTGPLVKLATHVIGTLGLAGVFVLTATSGVIGLPGTEPTMLFAGFNVYQGHLSLVWVIVFGVAGDMLGASIAYAIGHYGRRELFERRGGSLHMSTERMDRARLWFDRRGAPVIFFSRLIPFARAAFPYAAGVVEIPFGRFFTLATLGSVVWIGALAVLGREVGQQWQSWRNHLEYADYVALALLVAAIAYLILKRVRSGRAGATVDALSK